MEENKIEELENLNEKYTSRLEEIEARITELEAYKNQYKGDRQVIAEIQEELDARDKEKEELNKKIEDNNNKITEEKNKQIKIKELENQNKEYSQKIQELETEIEQIKKEKEQKLDEIENEFSDKEKWYENEIKSLNGFLNQYKNDSKIKSEVEEELVAKTNEYNRLSAEKENKKNSLISEYDNKITQKESEKNSLEDLRRQNIAKLNEYNDVKINRQKVEETVRNPKNTDPVKRFDGNDKDENLAEIDKFINEEVEKARKAKVAKEAEEARRLKESQEAYARNFKARNGFSIVDKAEAMDDPEIMDAEEGKKYFDLDDEESFDREDEKVAGDSYIDDDKFNSFIEKYKDDCSKAETIEMFNETISIMMEIAEKKEIGKEKISDKQYDILTKAIDEMQRTIGKKLYEKSKEENRKEDSADIDENKSESGKPAEKQEKSKAEEARKATQEAHKGNVAGNNYGAGPIYQEASAAMKKRNAAYEASLNQGRQNTQGQSTSSQPVATPRAQSIPAQPKATPVITPEASSKAGKRTEEIKDIEIKEHFGEDGKEKKSIKINGTEYELNRKLDEFTEGKINDICKEVLKLEDKMSIIKRIAFNRLKRKVDPAIVNAIKEQIIPAQELEKWTKAINDGNIKIEKKSKSVSDSIGEQGIANIAKIEDALKKFDSTMKQYVEAINSRNPNKLPFKITYDCSGKMSASEYNEISRYIKAANKLGVNIKGRRTFFGLFKARYNKNNALPNGNTSSKTNEGDKSFMNGYDSTGKDDSEVVITVPPRNPGKAKPNQKKSGKAKSSEQNVR